MAQTLPERGVPVASFWRPSVPDPAKALLAFAPVADTVSEPMRTRANQLLVAFLVIWLPFCCCQARAAAQVLAHAALQSETERAGAATRQSPRHSCCSDEKSTERPSCCDTSKVPAKDSCSNCITCKERVLPAAMPEINHDSIGAIDMVAMLTAPIGVTVELRTRTHAGAAYDTGPPTRPAGRIALALHSRLVV